MNPTPSPRPEPRLGQFTASWGEVCQCEVLSVDGFGLANINYVTEGKRVSDAYIPSSAIEFDATRTPPSGETGGREEYPETPEGWEILSAERVKLILPDPCLVWLMSKGMWGYTPRAGREKGDPTRIYAVQIPRTPPTATVTPSQDAEIASLERRNAELTARVAELEASLVEARKDGQRIEKLRWLTVNVRQPLVYGSRDLFWASPTDIDGDEEPSDIREQIDALPAMPLPEPKEAK